MSKMYELRIRLVEGDEVQEGVFPLSVRVNTYYVIATPQGEELVECSDIALLFKAMRVAENVILQSSRLMSPSAQEPAARPGNGNGVEAPAPARPRRAKVTRRKPSRRR